MKIDWLTLALLDLGQVREFIWQENPQAAERVCSRIQAVIEHLARLPEMGREGRRPGTRELILPDLPFRIVYRVHGDICYISYVVRATRDLSSLLSLEDLESAD